MSSIDCGRFIAELRKEKRITQTELADLLKVSNSAISRWETGEGFPDISIFPRLAEILNVTVDELLKGQRIEKEKKNSPKKTNRRFKNASFGSLVILISAFFIFVAITYSTYRVWYGVIAFIILSTISIIWFIFSRNEMMDECDYTDDDKHQIYNRTLIFYSSLITLFAMLIPQMVATTESNVVTTVMSLDYYLFWLIVIGFSGILITIVINIIHNKNLHINLHQLPMFNSFTVQDSIVGLTILIYTILVLVFNGFYLFFAPGTPMVIFAAISIHLFFSKKDTKKIFLIRIATLIIMSLMALLIAIGSPYSSTSNFPVLSFIAVYIAPIIIIVTIGVILIFSVIGIIKKSKYKEYDKLYRLHRHFIMLFFSMIFTTVIFNSITLMLPFSLPWIGIIISLLFNVLLFLVIEHYIEKRIENNQNKMA
ncbi:MAG: helix-turn-helix domain-containing protein [Firmicutes bacterium]|nr:helix-turn-helix domain-containing protein [Bacillota bacterium]